jgi:hypothetical protein
MTSIGELEGMWKEALLYRYWWQPWQNLYMHSSQEDETRRSSINVGDVRTTLLSVCNKMWALLRIFPIPFSSFRPPFPPSFTTQLKSWIRHLLPFEQVAIFKTTGKRFPCLNGSKNLKVLYTKYVLHSHIYAAYTRHRDKINTLTPPTHL